MDRTTSIFAALAMVLLGSAPASGQPCPANSFHTGGLGFYEESPTAPTWSFGPSRYDLVAGTCGAFLTGGGEAGSTLFLLVRDRYRIVGPESADPIPVTVRFRVTGLAGGGVYALPFLGPSCQGTRARLRLASGASLDEAILESRREPTCGDTAIDETLEIALAPVPGEEFEVAASLDLAAAQFVAVTTSGAISFAGLPPGAAIQSCQGYAGPVVPAARSSWGRLKGAYR